MIFDSDRIQAIETWVGAYGTDDRKLKIMTNMNKSKCLMGMDWKELYIQNLSHLSYAAGNVEKMAQFVSASCAIPGVVPRKKIEGSDYVDGGVVCASPLSYFHSCLVELSAKREQAFHFTCLTCEDLNGKEGGCYSTPSVDESDSSNNQVLQGLIETISSMLTVSLVRDRATSNQILTSIGSKLLGTVTFDANYCTLTTLQKFRKDTCRVGSILELYASGLNMYMDLANFDGQVCLKKKMEAEECMIGRLWVYSNQKESDLKVLENSNLLRLRDQASSENLKERAR